MSMDNTTSLFIFVFLIRKVRENQKIYKKSSYILSLRTIVELALVCSSTNETFVCITFNMTQTMLDSVVHNVLQKEP